MPFNTDTASQDNIETHTVEQVKSAGPKKAGTASAPTKGRAAKREGKRKSQGAEVGKRSATKSAAVLRLLRSAKGAGIEGLMKATGWQAHSVRGFLSATVKKKLGLAITSESGKDGVRRYRIEGTSKAG